MDIRTLILARTQTVVLDGDAVAAAATRPTRDSDLDRFEDELAKRGFVLTLDLATTMRRLPHGAIAELRGWILATLDAHLVREGGVEVEPVAATNSETPIAARRLLAWLAARPLQPCPWCATERELKAIAPCGHLVCAPCWANGTYVGCPICHRRVAQAFLPMPAPPPASVPRLPGDGKLRLLYLGFDVVAVARDRLQRLCSGTAPLTPDERVELEDMIDTVGPRAAQWLPRTIPRAETMAIAIARLLLVSPDRAVIAKGIAPTYLRDATEVIRVAVVLMGGTPSLVEPMRLGSLSRGLRRVVLDLLDRLPPDEVVEHACRRRGLWKRIGERLHPFEEAAARPTATLAFAVVRGTHLAGATFGAKLRAHATTVPTVRAAEGPERDTLELAAWAGPVEDGLRRGDPLLAIARLAQRPTQLLGRVDHVLRVVSERAPAVLPDALAAVRSAIRRGDPRALLALLHHLAYRKKPDETTRGILLVLRTELVARAEARRMFPRAVVDRAIPPEAWELAAIHAAARANTIYVRIPPPDEPPVPAPPPPLKKRAASEPGLAADGSGWATFRRRDGEPPVARLARLLANGPDDGRVSGIPTTDAPTWFALVSLAGLAAPTGSAGYLALDEPTPFERATLAQLADELARP